MNTEKIRQLHKQGKRPAKIASDLGYSRSDVESVINEISAAKRRMSLRLIVLVVVVVLAGVGALVLRSITSKPTLKPDRVIENKTQVRPASYVADQYMATTARPNKWYLKAVQADGEDHDFLLALAERTTLTLEKAVATYNSIPEIAVQKKMFGGKFYVSVYTTAFGGTSKRIYLSEKEAREVRNSDIEVVIYGQGHENEPRINNRSAFYDAEWRALFLAGEELSPEWFDAFALHELEHAVYDRKGESSAHAPDMSDLYITEEVHAHDLQGRVLDMTTRGKYLQRIREIVANKTTVKNLEELQDSITVDELLSLDRLFSQKFFHESGFRIGQYQFDLGDMWLKSRYSGDELLLQRIANYRLLRTI